MHLHRMRGFRKETFSFVQQLLAITLRTIVARIRDWLSMRTVNPESRDKQWTSKCWLIFMLTSRLLPKITLSGVITLPTLFDIFLPCASHNTPCSMIFENGNSPVNAVPNITILATQKNKMSWPVSIIARG